LEIEINPVAIELSRLEDELLSYGQDGDDEEFIMKKKKHKKGLLLNQDMLHVILFSLL
jgi:hypothetical protein